MKPETANSYLKVIREYRRVKKVNPNLTNPELFEILSRIFKTLSEKAIERILYDKHVQEELELYRQSKNNKVLSVT